MCVKIAPNAAGGMSLGYASMGLRGPVIVNAEAPPRVMGMLDTNTGTCDPNDGGGGGPICISDPPVPGGGGSGSGGPTVMPLNMGPGGRAGGLTMRLPNTGIIVPMPGLKIPPAVPNASAGFRAEVSIQVVPIDVCGLFIYCPETGVSLRTVSSNAAIFYFSSSATVSFQTAGGAGGYCPSSSGHTFSSGSSGGITPTSSGPYTIWPIPVTQTS